METKNQRTKRSQGILTTRWKSIDEKYEGNGKNFMKDRAKDFKYPPNKAFQKERTKRNGEEVIK